MSDKINQYDIYTLYKLSTGSFNRLVVYRNEATYQNNRDNDEEIDIRPFIPLTPENEGVIKMLYPDVDICLVKCLLQNWVDYYDINHEILRDAVYIVNEHGVR